MPPILRTNPRKGISPRMRAPDSARKIPDSARRPPESARSHAASNAAVSKARERVGDLGPKGLLLRDSRACIGESFREETIANSKLVSEKTRLIKRAEEAEAALEPTKRKAILLEHELSVAKAELTSMMSRLDLVEAEADLVVMDVGGDLAQALVEVEAARRSVALEFPQLMTAYRSALAESEMSNDRAELEARHSEQLKADLQVQRSTLRAELASVEAELVDAEAGRATVLREVEIALERAANAAEAAAVAHDEELRRREANSSEANATLAQLHAHVARLEQELRTEREAHEAQVAKLRDEIAAANRTVARLRASEADLERRLSDAAASTREACVELLISRVLNNPELGQRDEEMQEELPSSSTSYGTSHGTSHGSAKAPGAARHVTIKPTRRTAAEIHMLGDELLQQDSELPAATQAAVSKALAANNEMWQAKMELEVASVRSEQAEKQEELKQQIQVEQLQVDGTRLLYELRNLRKGSLPFVNPFQELTTVYSHPEAYNS
ncbi:hypothetical protein AB1Y20_016038 [Prymnesium parvum]|uniref:Uncharacterized protein n=1 Tax=Prymnesium parvum TaxID=97485 RepID=A0AB34K284_PRYPA